MNSYYLVKDTQDTRQHFPELNCHVISLDHPCASYVKLLDIQDGAYTRIDWHYVRPGNTEQEEAASETLTLLANGTYSDLGLYENWHEYLRHYQPIA